jgi:hypothetical protein
MQLDGKRLGRFRPCLLLPVVLPIPHQAFKARSLWHQMNVGEGSRLIGSVTSEKRMALKVGLEESSATRGGGGKQFSFFLFGALFFFAGCRYKHRL